CPAPEHRGEQQAIVVVGRESDGGKTVLRVHENLLRRAILSDATMLSAAMTCRYAGLLESEFGSVKECSCPGTLATTKRSSRFLGLTCLSSGSPHARKDEDFSRS